MNLAKRPVLVVLALALLGGCLPGRKSGSTGGSDSSSPVAILVSIEITGAGGEVTLGDSVALTCLGHYDSGAVTAVPATWQTSSIAIQLSATQGDSVTVNTLQPGTAPIDAHFGGLVAHGSIVISPDALPADPGTVYAADDAGVWAYPAAGGGAPTLVQDVSAIGYCGIGLTMTRSGSAVYYMVYTFSGESKDIYGFQPPDGPASLVASLSAATYDRPWGLDIDSQARLYTVCFGSYEVLRIDPADGSVTQVDTFTPWYGDIEVDSNDQVYYAPGYSSGDWIYRKDPLGGAPILWAAEPDDGIDGYIAGGLAINRRGEAFMTDVESHVLFKHRDLNNDGDALDAGEGIAYADLPGVGQYDYFVMGISAARGGSVLVNVSPDAQSAAAGLYWLADRNGDGDALDAGENSFYNGWNPILENDGGCVTARR